MEPEIRLDYSTSSNTDPSATSTKTWQKQFPFPKGKHSRTFSHPQGIQTMSWGTIGHARMDTTDVDCLFLVVVAYLPIQWSLIPVVTYLIHPSPIHPSDFTPVHIQHTDSISRSTAFHSKDYYYSDELSSTQICSRSRDDFDFECFSWDEWVDIWDVKLLCENGRWGGLRLKGFGVQSVGFWISVELFSWVEGGRMECVYWRWILVLGFVDNLFIYQWTMSWKKSN